MSSNKLDRNKKWILLGINNDGVAITHVQESLWDDNDKYIDFPLKFELEELTTEDLMFLIQEYSSFFDHIPEKLRTNELVLFNKLINID
jgi:hypothetical protein